MRANNVHRNFAGAHLFVQVARDVSTVSEEEHCRVGDFCAEHWDEYIYGVQFTNPNVALVPGCREAGLYPLGAKVCTESKAAGVGWHLDHIRCYDVKWPEGCDSIVFLQKGEPGVQVSSYLLHDPDFIERLLYAMDEVKQLRRKGRAGTTHDAQLSFPARDSISALVMHFRFSVSSTFSLYSASLSAGNLASPWVVSSSTPRIQYLCLAISSHNLVNLSR